MSIIRAQLLGNFHLIENDQPVTGFDRGRLQSFLAYLLVHAQTPQPRHYVAAVLWPDSAETQARTNLRKYIHTLRSQLPAVDQLFDLQGAQIQWRPDAPAVVDVHEFGRLLAQAQGLLQANQHKDAITVWAQAVDLYQGVLLPACYEEWVALPRERLASQYIQVLDQLAQLLERANNYSKAIVYVRLLLEQDTLRESSYRRLIHLYALAGNRAKALAVYQQCVQVLRRELDIEPNAATRKLYERVKGVTQNDVAQPNSQRMQKTMIWIDVAGFGEMAEQFESQSVVDDFVLYMDLLVEQIQQGEGTVVKRMGDALLAMADQAAEALQMVWQVQAVLQEFNRKQHQSGRPLFHTRISLATGEILLLYLNVGGVREIEVMGRCANLVARLQSLTPVNGIALDQLTYTQCKPLIQGVVTEGVFTDKNGREPIYILQP